MKESESPAPLNQAPKARSAESAPRPETRNGSFAPQTRGIEAQHSETSPRSIDLNIDELVLNGFAIADRYAIGNAFERELSRLFTEQGIPQALSENFEIGDIQGSALALERGLDAETIGSELARSVYRGLTR